MVELFLKKIIGQRKRVKGVALLVLFLMVMSLRRGVSISQLFKVIKCQSLQPLFDQSWKVENLLHLEFSLVLHPENPYIPTAHSNVRFFVAEEPGKEPIWWFGGGFDLTPFYGFDEDAEHWHTIAKKACLPFGKKVYSKYKNWCDDYFYLEHRDEQRGIGGLFFDDLNEGGFDSCFEFMKSVGDHFSEAYLPIVIKRKDTPYGKKERNFQLYRRGRYVEFNLIYDRGTLFGLQSGGRTESILMSMPPKVKWSYQFQVEKDSEEEKLYNHYLKPKEWIK